MNTGESFSKRVQPAMALAAARLDRTVSLADLAERADLSPFHLHRLFAAIAGETPKRYALRLRLNRAAAQLVATNESVLDVALACGFASHEGFTRAFRRQFGMTPGAYRARGLEAGGAAIRGTHVAAAHAEVVDRVGPCVGLYHVNLAGSSERVAMSYEIVTKDLAPQPVLLVRRRVKRSEIAATIGGVLPAIFQHAQQRGLALAGHPFTRYVEVGHGLMTIEPGMRIAGTPQPSAPAGEAMPGATAGKGGVVEDTLPGGRAVTTVHHGPYDTLHEAYAALEAWIESNGLQRAGAPWESYITDPAEHPDPKDWQTEVCWPVRLPRE